MSERLVVTFAVKTRISRKKVDAKERTTIFRNFFNFLLLDKHASPAIFLSFLPKKAFFLLSFSIDADLELNFVKKLWVTFGLNLIT